MKSVLWTMTPCSLVVTGGNMQTVLWAMATCSLVVTECHGGPVASYRVKEFVSKGEIDV